MRIRCLKIKVFFIVVMEKHIHKSQLNDHFVFQENDDIIFMIIKTTDHMIHSFKGDRNSFPGDKDTLLSVRSCDTFFDNIKSDNEVDIIIISKKVPKKIIDYVKTKSSIIFKNINLHIFEYDDLLFNIIYLIYNDEYIEIKDMNHVFFFKNEWKELK